MNSFLSIAPICLRQTSRLLTASKCVRPSCFTYLAEGCQSSGALLQQPRRRYSEIYYSKKHEYVAMESDSTGRVGISSYAQDKLGDVVYVQLPEVDRVVEQNEDVAAVESVKAASEVYSPISGTITEVNKALETDCALINKSPLEKGWIFKVSLSERDELKSLMNQAQYEKYLKNEAEEDDEHH